MGGVLHPWRRAMLPCCGTLGRPRPGVVHLLACVEVFDDPMLAAGLACHPGNGPGSLATSSRGLIFYSRTRSCRSSCCSASPPTRWGSSRLTLFSPSTTRSLWTIGALIVGGAVAIAAGLRVLRVRSFWPYLLGAGGLSWLGLYWSGLHPALALVPVMPFLPHAARDPGFFVDARPDAKGHAQPVRGVVAVSRAGRALLLRPGQRGRADGRTRGRDVGAAARGRCRPAAGSAGEATGLALALGFHLPHRVGWRELIRGPVLPGGDAWPASVCWFFLKTRHLPSRPAVIGTEHGRPRVWLERRWQWWRRWSTWCRQVHSTPPRRRRMSKHVRGTAGVRYRATARTTRLRWIYFHP